MRYGILDKTTSEIVSTYEADAPQYFGGPWSDPELFEHVEHPETLEEVRARKLSAFEAEGFARVAAVHPPHHLSRLGLGPPGNPEAQEALALVEAVKLAVNDAEDAMDLITDHEQLETFEPTWAE